MTPVGVNRKIESQEERFLPDAQGVSFSFQASLPFPPKSYVDEGVFLQSRPGHPMGQGCDWREGKRTPSVMVRCDWSWWLGVATWSSTRLVTCSPRSGQSKLTDDVNIHVHGYEESAITDPCDLRLW